MTPEQLVYVAIAAAVIGLVVRLLKEDVSFLPTVPSKYRPAVALGLGLVAGVLEAASRGTPWKQAVLDGLFAASAAIVGHGVFVDAMRGGRELGQPKPVAPEDAPTAPVLPPDPPSVPIALLFVGALLAAGVTQACSHASSSPIPAAAACVAHRTELQLACVDMYQTRPEIDACRARVQAEHDCTKDAGGSDQ